MGAGTVGATEVIGAGPAVVETVVGWGLVVARGMVGVCSTAGAVAGEEPSGA